MQEADLAEASWELVVISIANCTDFWRESRVLWSTGSTDWISTFVITSRFAVNLKLSFTLKRFDFCNLIVKIF